MSDSPRAPRQRASKAKRLRLGRPYALHSVLAVLAVVTVAASAAMLPRILAALPTWPAWAPDALVAGGAALVLAVTATGIVTFVRAIRMPRGTRGRARALISATAAPLTALAYAVVVALFALSARQWVTQGFGAAIDPQDIILRMAPGTMVAFWAGAAVSLSAWLTALGATIGSWFLIDERLRKIAWLALDGLTAGLFLLATLRLPIVPQAETAEDKIAAGVRLAVTVVFALRLGIRLLPPTLEWLERRAFEPLVAVRHLRAKKSNFLATIAVLSVLAVSFSSCSLTTTLSVMGGFRHDLKDKILGNNAHVAIDKDHDTFDGWGPVLERALEVPGVTAASPYVTGEVMVTSASNLAGAVLRGVNPDRVSDVTELEANMVRGKVDYLREPARLLDLPPEERRGPPSLDLRFEPGLGGNEDSEDLPDKRPLGDSEELLGGGLELGAPTSPDEDEADPAREGPSPAPDAADAPHEGPSPAPDAATQREANTPSEPSGRAEALAEGSAEGFGPDGDEVLPGIIVGQELARTLRLYVGDEVNVVSPFGELGPTGPMPKSRPFRVAGIFYSGMYEYDMKYTYVTLETAQRFLATGDAISGIDLKVDRIERAPEVAATLANRLDRPDLRVRDWQEMNKNLFGALELEKLAMFITLGIAILVAGFCVFGTLTLMVQEKSREVAILKAMGATRRSIVGLFLVEGLLIGLLGAALGLGLGFLVCYQAEHFGIRMNPEVYYIDQLPVHIDGFEFAAVGVSAALVCLAATIFPAVLASRMSPVDALRYE